MFTNLSEACCEAKRWKHLLNLTWLYTKASQTFSGTFSGTLLNLTWLCTKASRNLLRNLLQKSLPDLLQNLLRNPVAPGVALRQNLPDLLRNLLQKSLPDLLQNLLRNPVAPGVALRQNLPDLLRNLLRNPVEPDLVFHQSLPEPEPCWSWPGSAPKPPRPWPEPSEPSPEPGTSLNLTRRLHQCTPELFWAQDPISLRCWGKNRGEWEITRKPAEAGRIMSPSVLLSLVQLSAPLSWPTVCRSLSWRLHSCFWDTASAGLAAALEDLQPILSQPGIRGAAGLYTHCGLYTT